jgi:hypothetical protein
MNFKIRNLDTDDKSQYEKCERLYREHLDQFVKTSNSDLWKFFYWDFFHDGLIESITFQKDLSTVILRLDCPNIKRFKHDGSYEYLDFSFECTFSEVLSFKIQPDKFKIFDYPVKNTKEFCYSEINTAPILKTLDCDSDEYSVPLHSLLIRLFDNNLNSYTWLEIVFNQVDVVADEPIAFALMESDQKYELPLYYEKDNS